ncbi:hypothetical protein DH2020_025468 [Rehmannia glutinosa]|uniref:Uncharacterized protein n=1 Tax=Rehmannia glutinosa TaxID=99300 RepID=A0ABR0W3I0_REHGL
MLTLLLQRRRLRLRANPPTIMNLLTELIEGLGTLCSSRAPRYYSQKSPTVVFLCETKFCDRDFDGLKNSLGFFGISVAPCSRSAAGPLMASKFGCCPPRYNDRIIDVYITYASKNFVFLVSMVNRRSLGSRLLGISLKVLPPPTEPWICLGILMRFFTFMSSQGVIPKHLGKLIFSGTPLIFVIFRTWDFAAQSSLGIAYLHFLSLNVPASTDAFATPLFRSIFPWHTITNTPSFCSDHAFIVAQPKPHSPYHNFPKRKPPRFESFWVRSAEYNNGALASSDADIEKIIVDYFNNIFTSSSPTPCDIQRALSRIRPRISQELADDLTRLTPIWKS